VCLVGELPNNGPARPVVEEPLDQAWVRSAGDDHVDLGVACLDLLDVLVDRSRNVAVEAFGDLEGDAQDVPEVAPLLGEPLGLLGSTPRPLRSSCP
jgi:hypothetical protein